MSNKRVGYLRLSDNDDCNFESMSIANQRKKLYHNMLMNMDIR